MSDDKTTTHEWQNDQFRYVQTLDEQGMIVDVRCAPNVSLKDGIIEDPELRNGTSGEATSFDQVILFSIFCAGVAALLFTFVWHFAL